MHMSWIPVCLFFSVSLWLSAPGSVIMASGQGQKIDVQIVERGDDWQCPSMEERERARNKLHQIIASVLPTITPATTTTIPSTTTSAATMTTMTVERGDCSSTPGWRRVAFINMTDTSYNCPTGLSLTSYSKRTCGRSPATCTSTTFSVGGLSYSLVCGRIRGYQYGSTSAFGHSSLDINSHYVDGVSLTHGGAGSRQHIWTFAAGLSENTSVIAFECCPCDTPNQRRFPTFIGNDYFCESGLHSAWSGQFGVFHSSDTLWDGQGCTSNSTCCQFNNPPWFTKNLPTATTDDIELRICAYNNPYQDEDVPIELIELYVQ